MPEKRSKTSLAFRLNATLFFRQLRIIIWLDIMICVLFAAGLLYYTETTLYPLITGNLTDRIYLNGGNVNAGSPGAGRGNGRRPDATGNKPRTFTDGEILYEDASRLLYWVKDQPEALYPPEDLYGYLPEKLIARFPELMINLNTGRWLYYEDSGFSWIEQAGSLIYLVTAECAGGWLAAETYIGLPVFVFIRCFTVILIMEAISVLTALSRNSRSINRMLKPLQVLTASTQALTATGGRLSPEALKRLTGALDSINVSHLDARLPLSGISDELIPLAAAINEMLTRIDEAYREQIRFVSDASHELRTPIAVIQGYADLLSRWGTEDPETMKESIAAIRQEAMAMKEMVEQLLFLARGESDFMSVDWKAVDVSALSSEVIREIEMIDPSHRFSLRAEPSVIVGGDDGLLKQLMRILVDNSIKYTPANGMISLRVEKRDGQAAIIVQDEGEGIPEEAIPHIFDRFYRADESRTRETGGSGLGLSIAKWIAQRHKGSIEVMSREKIGTRMTVLLPLYGEDHRM